MLTRLVVRIWATTLLYLGVSSIIWFARHTTYAVVAYGLLGFVTVSYGQILIKAIDSEQRLDALGKRPPRVRDSSPFGLGLLAQALWYFSHHQNHVFWWKFFSESGDRKNPYTVEGITVGERIVFTADEENIKAILASQFQDFGKGPQFRKEWKDFLGLSIFTTDGEMWHNSRALLRPQFLKDRVSDLHKFESHVQVMLPLLAGSQNGATVRIDDLFYRFSLDAATDFLLGKSVDSLHDGDNEFAGAFTAVQHTQAIIARAGPLNWLVPKKSFYKGLKVFNAFINRYIDQALQLPQDELEKMTKSDEGYNFLHALATYTRDRDVIRDQIAAVLLAGRDTTAAGLSWIFYELSRHPRVVQKLRQEIMNFVGPNRQPTYSDLKSMRYLQHTMNESLRLYPLVPYNVRVALHDTTLPRGGGPDGNEPIGILKDTPIGYSTLVLQQRADIYPPASSGFPDHREFVPERWDKWIPTPWTYIPFNGGPRICIGQQFALTEMSYTIVRVLQTFERIESRQDEFPGNRTDIVLQPANGVHVAFYKAE